MSTISSSSGARTTWQFEPSQGIASPLETETVAQLESEWKVGPRIWARAGDWILYLGPSSTNLSESGTDILRRGSSAGPTARKMHSFRWLTAWRISGDPTQEKLWETYVSAWIEARSAGDLPKQAFKARAVCYRTQAFAAGLLDLEMGHTLRRRLRALLENHRSIIERLEITHPRHDDLTQRSLEIANWVLESQT